MRVNVFGLGYVGSVTAACLAKAGHEVTGVDVDEEKVAMINRGASPVVEPGLDALVAEVVRAHRLRATISTPEALRNATVGLICVGTPSGAGGQLRVDAVERVGKEIGQALAGLQEPYTVVLRSTVLPGTVKRVLVPALGAGAGGELGPAVHVAVNPEFMREGSAIRDFADPPFTLVGCADPGAAAVLRSLYAEVEAPFVHTAVTTAEMVKYVSNTFHALKVCFANEIADVCTALGADAQKAMEIFFLDRRLNVSEAYLRPGFAFGGSCLPKDVRALVYAARAADLSLPLLASILPSNDGQICRAAAAVLATRRRKIGVVGLAFKPGTDDLRESPIVTLVETLIGKGCDVRILDPNVTMARLRGANRRYIEEEIPHIASLLCDSVETLLAHAEVLVVGNASDDAMRALAVAEPRHIVVDLTRGAAADPSRADRSSPPRRSRRSGSRSRRRTEPVEAS